MGEEGIGGLGMRRSGGGGYRRIGKEKEGLEGGEGEWQNHGGYRVSLKQAIKPSAATFISPYLLACSLTFPTTTSSLLIGITSYIALAINYLDFQHYVCDKKSATMDHEGPSMSVIIYIDHQLTSLFMFTSIPVVERRRSTQVV